MNLPPPHLRLVIPPCFDPCRSPLGRVVSRRAADARQAEAFLILTVAMIVLFVIFGGYLGWALVPPGSRPLFTAILGGALVLIATSLIGRRPAIIVEAHRGGLQIRHERRARTRDQDSSTRGFPADAGSVGTSADAGSVRTSADAGSAGASADAGYVRTCADAGYVGTSAAASLKIGASAPRGRRSAAQHPPDGALKDVLLHIPYSSIERTARIDRLTFHRHYRRYEQTRAFVNRMPSELILMRVSDLGLMRVSDLDSTDRGSVEGQRGGETGRNPAACRGVPIILGLAVESDRTAFEALLTEVASVAPASSWADVV